MSAEQRHLIAPWAFALVAVLGVGAWAAHRHLSARAPAVAARKPPVAPDHRALIADRSPAVIERGRAIFAKDCASCHGAAGDANPANISPAPRNFHREPMRNPLGGGPYAWFEVLTNGYGTAMPGFRTLAPADRYAVAHFVRETWVRPVPALYVENDPPEVAARIPAAGAAEAVVDLDKVAPPAALQPALAAAAARGEAEVRAVSAWFARARAAGGTDPLLEQAAARAARLPGAGASWLVLARAGDAAGLGAALVSGDGGLPPAGDLALAPGERVADLARRLVAAAAPAAAVPATAAPAAP